MVKENFLCVHCVLCVELKAAKMPDTSIKDFAAAIAELETIVKKLEDGDLPLEQSLALYERGVQLSRFCHARLEEAERRIEILTDRGELKPAPSTLGPDDVAPAAGGSARPRPDADRG
jgi:exodeoxyribonuclease VII small subunit